MPNVGMLQLHLAQLHYGPPNDDQRFALNRHARWAKGPNVKVKYAGQLLRRLHAEQLARLCQLSWTPGHEQVIRWVDVK